MIRLKRTWGMLVIGLGLLGSVGGVARAGEEDDLQRQIDTQRASAWPISSGSTS